MTSSEMDLRERVKGLEVAEQYRQKVMNDQGNTIHRIGQKVIDNEKWAAQIQDEVQTMKPKVDKVMTAYDMVMAWHKAWVLLRALGNTGVTAAVVLIIYSGHATSETVSKWLAKIVGIGG